MSRRWFAPSLSLVALVGAVVALIAADGARSALHAQKGTASPTWAAGGKRERYTPDNCVIALIDHQTGLMNLVDSSPSTDFKSLVIALAKTAKLHAVPTVITTSAESGPNGPFLPEVLALLPDAPLISRPGQINAWENAEFVEAIRKTGREKIVMAGITTDVCVTFAALSALDAGFEVYVVTDVSGAQSPMAHEAAIERMSQAGATIGTWFGIACELLYDWRNPTGAGSAQLFVDHMPSYAEIYHSHRAQSGAKQ